MNKEKKKKEKKNHWMSALRTKMLIGLRTSADHNVNFKVI